MKKLVSFFLTALFLFSISAPTPAAHAEAPIIGYMGDLNSDQNVNTADVVILSKYLLNFSALHDDAVQYADMDKDGQIDGFDLVLLRKTVLGLRPLDPIYGEETDFIDPPIYDLYGSLPSQGDAKLLIFYVDFPDCKYDYEPSMEQVEKIAFGDEDPKNNNYPFESMKAFYKRSSKGVMELDGKAYRYTTKNSKSYYENDSWKIKLVNEVMAEMDKYVDLSEFDGDDDDTIDAILFNVPTSAGDDNWWPCAGIFGGDRIKRYDGKTIGHVITGNAQIKSASDFQNFNSTYLHEMGHCMGLPDFYLYNKDDDWEGLHGSAGYALMDDSLADFSAISKLQLGWYKEDQVQVYDASEGEQSFKLYNCQTDAGNCLIIPCGELNDKYRSEYFIIEYFTLDNNNRYVDKYYWWKPKENGIRVFRIEASQNDNEWYPSFRYSSGNNEDTNYDNGRRFVRLIDDSDTYNIYKSGNIIDNKIPGFRWYDSSGYQTVDTGLKITIGDLVDGAYTITVSAA